MRGVCTVGPSVESEGSKVPSPILEAAGGGLAANISLLGVQTGPQANNTDLGARLKGSVVAPKPRSPTFLPGQTGYF